MLPCSLCRGFGYEECFDCSGSGYYDDDDDDEQGEPQCCETCHGMGERECIRCEGEGEEWVDE